MPFARGLSRLGGFYAVLIATLGLLAIGESLFRLYQQPVGAQWLVLAGLTLISGSASVRLPGVDASISISEAFVCTAVLLYGAAAGTLTAALDGLVISFWIAKRRPDAVRAFFNIAAPTVSAWVSAHLFFYTSGIDPLAFQPVPAGSTIPPLPVDQILPSLALFAAVYFSLNSWLIALVIGFEKRQNPFHIWRTEFIWLSLNYFCGASVAILLVGYSRTVDLRFVAVTVPLLLVLYFTFKTSMQRVEDANRHLGTLNALYMSTIETLAMAIDAKDQITHGHIRRVQAYAVGLAKHIGVTDVNLIRAIEAASLLHDMGKLAVPEYILNKPGKLTPAEFEKMKLHATVGADILSAIAFPYPVVPIVRHHHEYWNGGGYPSGIKGTDIPIGARILAVVDCFDALTSDRPYRPRLSDSDAIDILRERRGTMYDPLVVDAFQNVHDELVPTATLSGPSSHALREIASSTQAGSVLSVAPGLEGITASSDESSTMYELSRSLAEQKTVVGVGEVVSNCLRRLVPFTMAVIYLYESTSDELEAAFVSREHAGIVKGLRITLGQRLSGWVAANRQTILNSDASLDLGEIARTLNPRLRNCLSTPLLDHSELIGVLSMYSSTTEGFTEDHKRIVEAVARQATETCKRAAESEGIMPLDPLTGLPNLRQLERVFINRRISDAYSEIGFLFVDVVDLKQVNVLHGRSSGDEVLRHVVEHIRLCLPLEHSLFRYGSDEFVAVVQPADRPTAARLLDRICKEVQREPLKLSAGPSITVQVTAMLVWSPTDGDSIKELAAAARRKEAAFRQPSIH